MSNENVTDLRDYRVFRALGLDPNVVISGSSTRAIARYKDESLRELASALSLSLDDAIAAVQKLQEMVVEHERDETDANLAFPSWLRETQYLAVFSELLKRDPERRWAVVLERGSLRFVHRPLAFARFEWIAQAYKDAQRRDDIPDMVKAVVEAGVRWERLLATFISDDYERMRALVDELPSFGDIEPKLRDLQNVLNDLKASSEAYAAALKADREETGSLISTYPERL